LLQLVEVDHLSIVPLEVSAEHCQIDVIPDAAD
jgi:hypothetical protein